MALNPSSDPFRPFLDSLKGLQQASAVFQHAFASIERNEGILAELLETQRRLANIGQPFLEAQERMDRIMRSFTEPFVRLSETLRQLPSRTRAALVRLGERGWYLDLEMPLPWLWELDRAIASGDHQGAEEALVEYFDTQRDKIKGRLIKWFPARARIFECAFAAHARGECELSVPLFLIQADGICQELIGIQLFKRRDGVPVLAKHVESVPEDTFRAAFLHPLAQPLPISASAKERESSFLDARNRHAVLHGESVDYGTATNSLKAMSLLSYVADVLRRPSLAGDRTDAA